MTPAENLKDKMHMIEKISELQTRLARKQKESDRWQERYYEEREMRGESDAQLRANDITPGIWG